MPRRPPRSPLFPYTPLSRPLPPPLQRAHLPVLKATGILSLQELEDRLSLKPGVVFKQLLHIAPNIEERIWPGPPAHRRCQLARQPAMTDRKSTRLNSSHLGI